MRQSQTNVILISGGTSSLVANEACPLQVDLLFLYIILSFNFNCNSHFTVVSLCLQISLLKSQILKFSVHWRSDPTCPEKIHLPSPLSVKSTQTSSLCIRYWDIFVLHWIVYSVTYLNFVFCEFCPQKYCNTFHLTFSANPCIYAPIAQYPN